MPLSTTQHIRTSSANVRLFLRRTHVHIIIYTRARDCSLTGRVLKMLSLVEMIKGFTWISTDFCAS